MSTACSKIIRLRGLLAELGFTQHDLTPFYVYNTSVIQISTNPVFHECTKHIKVDCHSIHEACDDISLMSLLNFKLWIFLPRLFLARSSVSC